MPVSDVFDVLRVSVDALFHGAPPRPATETHASCSWPAGGCPCGNPRCDVVRQVEYLGHGRWTLPEHWSTRPTQSSHGKEWQIFDSYGREHLVTIREG